MRFLVLPGYLQSGKILAEKSSGLRKLLKKSNHELEYIDPPKVLQSAEELPFKLSDNKEEEEQKFQQIVDTNNNRCWWDPRDQHEFEGFEQSYDYVVKYINENGPFDGIIGFSQGAGMALVLLQKFTFKCCLSFSGFCLTKPVDPSTVLEGEVDPIEFQEKYQLNPRFAGLYDTNTNTKIFNIHGGNDVVVQKYKSLYVEKVYKDVESFEFEGGHMMPNKKPFLLPIVEKINALQ